jgi:PAS domain-containing protein
MFVAWGEELGFLYNDAYAEILGDKHPGALGARFYDNWSEIWADISPLIEAALAGESSYHEDLLLVVNRKGFDEEAWFTFSYSPVRDETGQVAGMFCSAVESTDRVLAERRNASERERLARMFEQAPGFITVLDGPEHVFDFANATYRRLFGNRDFVGKSVRHAFPDLEGQGFFELLDQVYFTGERFVARHIPIRLSRSSGRFGGRAVPRFHLRADPRRRGPSHWNFLRGARRHRDTASRAGAPGKRGAFPPAGRQLARPDLDV